MSALDDFLKGFRDVALETGRQDYQKAHFIEGAERSGSGFTHVGFVYGKQPWSDELPGIDGSYESVNAGSSSSNGYESVGQQSYTLGTTCWRIG